MKHVRPKSFMQFCKFPRNVRSKMRFFSDSASQFSFTQSIQSICFSWTYWRIWIKGIHAFACASALYCFITPTINRQITRSYTGTHNSSCSQSVWRHVFRFHFYETGATYVFWSYISRVSEKNRTRKFGNISVKSNRFAFTVVTEWFSRSNFYHTAA